jgi:hypothetical protein
MSATYDFRADSGTDGKDGVRGQNGTNGRRKKDGYTKGGNGKNGGNGSAGSKGSNGKQFNATISAQSNYLDVHVSGHGSQRKSSRISVNTSGGRGGRGGDGGRGGRGGSGSPSGRSGKDGRGANGADGGHAGNIKIRFDNANILGILNVRHDGGNGGRGGSGSASGRSGSDGRDGDCLLICEDVISGNQFERSVPGLELQSRFNIEYDDDLINGRITQGSRIKINQIQIYNPESFTLHAPFTVRINKPSDLILDTQSIVINESLPPRRTATYDGEITGRLKHTCGFDTFDVSSAPHGKVSGINFSFYTSPHEDEIETNHRILPEEAVKYELSSDMVRIYHSMSYKHQLALNFGSFLSMCEFDINQIPIEIYDDLIGGIGLSKRTVTTAFTGIMEDRVDLQPVLFIALIYLKSSTDATKVNFINSLRSLMPYASPDSYDLIRKLAVHAEVNQEWIEENLVEVKPPVLEETSMTSSPFKWMLAVNLGICLSFSIMLLPFFQIENYEAIIFEFMLIAGIVIYTSFHFSWSFIRNQAFLKQCTSCRSIDILPTYGAMQADSVNKDLVLTCQSCGHLINQINEGHSGEAKFYLKDLGIDGLIMKLLGGILVLTLIISIFMNVQFLLVTTALTLIGTLAAWPNILPNIQHESSHTKLDHFPYLIALLFLSLVSIDAKSNVFYAHWDYASTGYVTSSPASNETQSPIMKFDEVAISVQSSSSDRTIKLEPKQTSRAASAKSATSVKPKQSSRRSTDQKILRSVKGLKGQYYVKVMSSRHKSKSLKTLETYRERFPSQYVFLHELKIKGKNYFRLYVGSFKSSSSAKKHLKKHKYKGTVKKL